MKRWGLAICSLLVVASFAHADRAPWRARRRTGMRPNLMANERVAPTDWGSEPATPTPIDLERFVSAYQHVCDWAPPSRVRRYAELALRYGTQFDVDPFLLASISYRFGKCRADNEDEHGVGLGWIPRDMYAASLRGGAYRFQVLQHGALSEHVRRLDAFPFAGPRLMQAEPSFYFTAGLLASWRDQHETVDHAFEQVPHRHYVSHFVWGDRVRSSREEDGLFTDRRRMLRYYGALPCGAPETIAGVECGSPLDGEPRVVSSGIGSDRDGGERSHRGIDLESLPGEPVLALAAGRVSFAGVDWPGQASNEQMTREEIEAIPRADLGRGGRYVCIVHSPALRSCYMHLEAVEVRYGQTVARGERIGTVGRTGMQTSAAHLHLELHGESGLIDASRVFPRFIIGTPTP